MKQDLFWSWVSGLSQGNKVKDYVRIITLKLFTIYFKSTSWPGVPSLVLHVSQIWQLSITTACKHGVIPLSHRF